MSKHLKILLGGSPCTYWSISQSSDKRETEASGIGWELFENYLYARDKFKPDYFLYENNKSAVQPIKDQISKELGVDLQYINSALVSAQNRQRFYGHNIPNVPQPDDRGILLRNILDSGVAWNEKAYSLTTRCSGAIPEDTIEKKRHTMVAEPVIFQTPRGNNNGGMKYKKSPTLTANGAWTDNNKVVERITATEEKALAYFAENTGYIPEMFNAYNRQEITEKSPTLSTGSMRTSSCAVTVISPYNGKTYPVYEVKNGLIEIKGKTYPIKLQDGYYIIRKLTVNECRRLQTIPEWYKMPCSASQNYKMLGNGWTIEVIKHILRYIPDISDCTVEVLSMYDGMSCGQITLAELGCQVERYVSYEIDKYAIQTTQANFAKTIQRGDAFQLRNTNWNY
ncbi:MAG: hypothetical protein EOM87_06720 [Clostridia bacterium]|nr:hypothetical protein [Clostridia bacterium]